MLEENILHSFIFFYRSTTEYKKFVIFGYSVLWFFSPSSIQSDIPRHRSFLWVIVKKFQLLLLHVFLEYILLSKLPRKQSIIKKERRGKKEIEKDR